MKKIVTLTSFVVFSLINAQSGNVGINTTTPQATLDILTSGNTNATKAFRILNSSNTEMVTVLNNRYVGIGNPAPAVPLDVKGLINALDFRIFAGTSSAPTNYFQHFSFFGAGSMNNGNPGAQMLLFSNDNNPLISTSGLYIGPTSDVTGGIYIGEDGKNGVALNGTFPTTTLDVGGSIRIADEPTPINPVVGSTCTKAGQIVYGSSPKHFFGCVAGLWKQLDN